MKNFAQSIILAVVAAVFAGCDKGVEAPESAPGKKEAVERRMQDPAYKKTLTDRLETRNEILRELSKRKRQIAELEASGSHDVEGIASLKKERDSFLRLLEKHEADTRLIVAQQIRSDIEQQKTSQNQKGK